MVLCLVVCVLCVVSIGCVWVVGRLSLLAMSCVVVSCDVELCNDVSCVVCWCVLCIVCCVLCLVLFRAMLSVVSCVGHWYASH